MLLLLPYSCFSHIRLEYKSSLEIISIGQFKLEYLKCLDTNKWCIDFIVHRK